MTVVSESVVEGPFYPNGVTVTFPFTFEVSDTDEISATLDGVAIDSADYDVTLNDDGTGSVTFFTAPAGDGATNELYLFSDPDFTQQTTLQNQGPYFQSTLEAIVDHLAICALWLRDRVTRSFIIPRAGAERDAVVGMFPVVLADGTPGWSSGTGADAGLRADLASTSGAGMVGTTNFSGTIIPNGSNAQQAMQALETDLDIADDDIDQLQSDITPLTDAGDVGLDVLSRFNPEEARTAIGIQEGKRITMATNGMNYIMNANDFAPALHYGNLSAAGTVRLDVGAMLPYHDYHIVNESVVDGVVEIDCGDEYHFRGAAISPSVSTTKLIKLFPSQLAVLKKTGGNRIHVTIVDQGYWIVSSVWKQRRLRDGTYEVIYTRTASISAGAESTANNINTALDLTNADVLSVTYQTDAGGTAQQNYPCQVTKKGTTHALAAYQFAIRNPNAAAVTHPILVHFINVTGP